MNREETLSICARKCIYSLNFEQCVIECLYEEYQEEGEVEKISDQRLNIQFQETRKINI